MLSEGTKRFDLYDFFSVLLPGAGLLVGVAPFLPENTPISSTGIIGVLLVGGFIAGRGMHAFALSVEKRTDAESHRDKFQAELKTPSDVSEELIDNFYMQCVLTFPQLDLPKDRSDFSDRDDASKLFDALYVMVRSTIHMDARGRSRTFQAVLDFYRSMWLVSALLATIYVIYALNQLYIPLFQGVGYQPYITTLDIPPWYVFFGGIVLWAGAYMTFKRVRTRYRRYFIQYMCADFIIITSTDSD